MKRLRPVLFWLHLLCGVVAGLVIVVMSLSGAILAFKPQIVNFIDRDARVVNAADMHPRLGVHELLRRVRVLKPDARLTSVAADANPSEPVVVSVAGGGTIYLDPHSGAVLGEGSASAQSFFRSVENWHRWLAVSNENRATGRMVTDACNAAFLVLALSGLFLWWPRKWLPQHVKAILWFKRSTSARARDFNWHNVIGFWCAPVLIVLTMTGVIMSYTWASNLLYQLSGSPLPPPRAANGPEGPGRAGRGEGRGGAAEARGERQPRAERGESREARGEGQDAPPPIPDKLDELWAYAEGQVPQWRTITMRLPGRREGPVSFSIVDQHSWSAFARSQLTMNAATGMVVNWQPYAGNSLGQKMRQWSRFAHTGELGGWPGQAVAGLASLGALFLVWTGLALACRRLFAWRIRRGVAMAARAIDARGAVAAK